LAEYVADENAAVAERDAALASVEAIGPAAKAVPLDIQAEVKVRPPGADYRHRG
jgi:hypothetical protein